MVVKWQNSPNNSKNIAQLWGGHVPPVPNGSTPVVTADVTAVFVNDQHDIQ